MNRRSSLLWSLCTVFAAALVAYSAARFATSHSDEEAEALSLHEWLHANLGISAEQEMLLAPVEESYHADRDRLRREIDDAGRRLAEAIGNHEEESQEVGLARAELTRLQGELQQSTLDHFFAMKKVLTPEQGEKLVEWTHQSIVNGRAE